MSDDKMHRPRENNGRFTTLLSLAQFEEFREGQEQRFKAQERAVASALAAVDKLAESHAKAHEREHDDSTKMQDRESKRVDDRLLKVEETLDTRLRALEDSDLTDDVRGARALATASVIGSGLVGIIVAVRVILG